MSNLTAASPILRLCARLAAAGLAALALAGCQRHADRPPCPSGQVCLEYGNGSDPSTIDPQTSQLVDESVIIGDLMMGLTTEAADGSAIPGMATSWETSPDGLTWTFHLRQANWSDGQPVTADDFVYAYRRILEPETAATYAYLVAILKNGQAVNAGKAPPQALGAKALDAHTLQLTLEHPAPYLPQIAKHHSFFPVPRHVVERYGEGWTQPGRYVSNGAYRLVSWRLGDYLRVEKNPNFFDAKNVCVDRIDFYPTTDAVAAERRVAAGELDANTSFQSNRISRLRAKMAGYVRTHSTLATTYLIFNTADFAPFRDVRVRQALAMSVDREFITGKLMRAGQIPAYAFVPPGISSYVPGPTVAWARLSFAERQAQARRLLAAAGYGPGRPLKVEMKSANATDTQLISQAIQADWRAVGVETQILQNEGQIAFAAYRARDFQTAPISWYADYDDPLTFLELFKSDTGVQNYGDYKNPAYDALLIQADQERDVARRAQILARAEQMMLDDATISPIYFVVNRNLVSPRITGWVDNATDTHRARWLCTKER